MSQSFIIDITFGLFGFGPVLALTLVRKRIGVLNAASWLVVWGALIIALEHGQFAIAYTAVSPYVANEVTMTLIPHARVHFFMAGIYALIGMILLGVIARTLLKEGRPVGWFSVLFALLVGGSFDLVVGGLWFQHGSPLYQLFGVSPILGFGWTTLYGYYASWIAALLIAYGPIFRKVPASEMVKMPGGSE